MSAALIIMRANITIEVDDAKGLNEKQSIQDFQFVLSKYGSICLNPIDCRYEIS